MPSCTNSLSHFELVRVAMPVAYVANAVFRTNTICWVEERGRGSGPGSAVNVSVDSEWKPGDRVTAHFVQLVSK